MMTTKDMRLAGDRVNFLLKFKRLLTLVQSNNSHSININRVVHQAIPSRVPNSNRRVVGRSFHS
jgi:hypothetical protein